MISIQQGLQSWTVTQIIPSHKKKTKEQQAFSVASTKHFPVICHYTEDIRPFVTTVLNLAVCCGLMEAARFFCTQVKEYLKLLYLRYCGRKVSFFCRSFIFH